MLILLLSHWEPRKKNWDEPCLFPDCGVRKLSISPDSVSSKGLRGMRMIPQRRLKGGGGGSKPSCLFSFVSECAWEFLSHRLCLYCASLCNKCGLCVFMCRWPGVASHAPPTATVYEEPQQWNADPPQEQCDSVVARGNLHAVLLHALPSDGVGKPECGALQGYLANREVRSKHGEFKELQI